MLFIIIYQTIFNLQQSETYSNHVDAYHLYE